MVQKQRAPQQIPQIILMMSPCGANSNCEEPLGFAWFSARQGLLISRIFGVCWSSSCLLHHRVPQNWKLWGLWCPCVSCTTSFIISTTCGVCWGPSRLVHYKASSGAVVGVCGPLCYLRHKVHHKYSLWGLLGSQWLLHQKSTSEA